MHFTCEAPDSASRLVSFDADSYSHTVEVRSGDAESGASVDDFDDSDRVVVVVVDDDDDDNGDDDGG